MGIAIITLEGLNLMYEQDHGNNIFEDINIPEGINKDTLITRIMFRCMEFSVMHTDPDFAHYQILNFFDIHYETFSRWIRALEVDYDPLENYNRYEEYHGSGEHDNSIVTDEDTRIDSEGTDKTDRSAFNDSGYEPYDRLVKTDGSIGSANTDTADAGTYADDHTIHTHGNIGVTTSQQMLESEWEVAKLNVYTAIADMFCDEFCIMVY